MFQVASDNNIELKLSHRVHQEMHGGHCSNSENVHISQTETMGKWHEKAQNWGLPSSAAVNIAVLLSRKWGEKVKMTNNKCKTAFDSWCLGIWSGDMDGYRRAAMTSRNQFVWLHHCTATARLYRVWFGMPNTSLGVSYLPSRTYSSWCLRKARKIVKDSSHTSHSLFTQTVTPITAC